MWIPRPISATLLLGCGLLAPAGSAQAGGGPRFITYDTSGARDPALLAVVERLTRAAAARDAAAIKALAAPGFRAEAIGAGNYRSDARIVVDLSKAEDPLRGGIYGLVTFPRRVRGLASSPRRGGLDPAVEAAARARDDADAVTNRDAWLVEAVQGLLWGSPVGRAAQAGSATCLPAEPLVPPDIARDVMAHHDSRKKGSRPSPYRAAIDALEVYDTPSETRHVIATLLPRQIFREDETARAADQPPATPMMRVILTDGRRGWVDTERHMLPLFRGNFEGVCFGTVDGAWKMVFGVVQRTR